MTDALSSPTPSEIGEDEQKKTDSKTQDETGETGSVTSQDDMSVDDDKKTEGEEGGAMSSTEDETDGGKTGETSTAAGGDSGAAAEDVDDPGASINVQVTLGAGEEDTADGGRPTVTATATVEGLGSSLTAAIEGEPSFKQGDIPIKFINETGETDFTVVVFMKNEDPNASATPFVAWRTIRTQTSAAFTYPSQSEVGAIYFEGDMKMTAGPYPALPGSTWEFAQESEADTPTLIEGKLWRIAFYA